MAMASRLLELLIRHRPLPSPLVFLNIAHCTAGGIIVRWAMRNTGKTVTGPNRALIGTDFIEYLWLK